METTLSMTKACTIQSLIALKDSEGFVFPLMVVCFSQWFETRRFEFERDFMGAILVFAESIICSVYNPSQDSTCHCNQNTVTRQFAEYFFLCVRRFQKKRKNVTGVIFCITTFFQSLDNSIV